MAEHFFSAAEPLFSHHNSSGAYLAHYFFKDCQAGYFSTLALVTILKLKL